ncbi:MAG: fumarylacetoacetate hydrolase family protein, partial [Sulfitobacter sp.]
MTLMTSWVESANSADTDFPLNNLPYGVFSTNSLEPRCGVAIGDQILDMAALEEAGIIELSDEPVFDVPYWNDVMELGPDAWEALRTRLIQLLTTDAADQATVAPHLVPMSEASLHLPMVVSEYTDFYAGRHHATNVGTMFRGAENALPPNWLHIPIGYNGRASTVVVSGTAIHRPNGQLKAPDADMPSFGPCKRLDIELEMGAIVGTSTDMGTPVSVGEADEMIFGYVLLNDW